MPIMQGSSMKVSELRRPGAGDAQTPSQPMALFRLGFRPLYLLAAALAALAVPVWLAQFLGLLPAPPHLPALLWHAHELIFGFTVAVIAGFLLTASQNWTGLPTTNGARLAGMCLIWIAARLANWLAPPLIALALDAAFLISVMVALGSVLWRSGNTRNFFILAILSAFLAASTLFHLALPGRLAFDPMTPLYFAIFVIVILVSIIGGRVIPMFTANAVRGVRQWRNDQFDTIAIAATACALLLVLGGASPGIAATTCGIAAVLQAIRLAGWNPPATRHNPLLWILHVSYAWIPIGLALLAFAELGKVPQSAAMHALTVGAISGMIVGMITRTALGHTGYPLAAGRAETAMYVLIQAAVVLRIAPLLLPLPMIPLYTGAAIAWTAAFVLYLITYGPKLSSPRADGRPG